MSTINYDHVEYDDVEDSYYGVELNYSAYDNMPTPEEYYDSEEIISVNTLEDDMSYMSSIPF